MKKILSLLLALCLALTPLLLAGCDRLFGQSETTSAVTETGVQPETYGTESEISSSGTETSASSTQATTKAATSRVTTTKATTTKATTTRATTTRATTTRSTTTRSTTTRSTTSSQGAGVNESGKYYSKDDVALYIHRYGHLPSNYITKDKARSLGWQGGSVEPYFPGGAIGGDYYGNYEGELPSGKTYHECDIDTLGKSSRGAKRLVYSTDGAVYYTSDHYETFTKLY